MADVQILKIRISFPTCSISRTKELDSQLHHSFRRRMDFLQRIYDAFPARAHACKTSIAEYESECDANIFIIANGALRRRRVERCDCRRSAPGARPDFGRGGAVFIILPPCDPDRLVWRVGARSAGNYSFVAAKRLSVHCAQIFDSPLR